MTDDEIEDFRRVRTLAGQRIDAQTAEVTWMWVEVMDPYSIEPNLPGASTRSWREFFARAPGSDTWVWFGDLPDATKAGLWQKHRSWLPFPRDDPGAIAAERLPVAL